MVSRWPVLVFVLGAACGGAAAHGPAWPKPHESETDGGESLAPRVASQLEASDDEDDDAGATATSDSTDTKAAAATPADDSTTPDVTPAPSQDEPVNAEDIVIEIDDD